MSTKVTLPTAALLRHMMALGSSGSGKTVLCKVVVEEVVRRGVPVLCVDPQGDLCSLLAPQSDPSLLQQHGIDSDIAKRFAEQADVVVFTPASRKGVPLCADPVDATIAHLDGVERMQAVTRTAAMIASLLGYDLESDEGAGLSAVFDSALARLADEGRLRGLASLTSYLSGLEGRDLEPYGRFLDKKRIQAACQRLARLEVGARRLLFHDGVPLDIDLLLGREPTSRLPNKTRVSVVFLNTLHHQEDKDFFVAALADRLYAWMLKNPSTDLQALFYIDEVAPFIPPVRKPACKEGLQILFKQARKYGLGCLMATQNPGDVDYRAMAQFGTWALGRLTTRQDLKKIEPTIKALDPQECDAIMGELPALKPGQFVFLSPDHLGGATHLQTRWLLTEHATYDEERIEGYADVLWRTRFAHLETPAEAPAPKRGLPQPAAPAVESPASAEDLKPAEPERMTPVPPTLSDPEIATPPRVATSPILEPAVPSAAPAVQPSSSPPVVPDNDRERWLGILAQKPCMSAKDFAHAAKLGEQKARNVLSDLASEGLAGQYKQGRTLRTWARSRGSRPDLGLDQKVPCIAHSFGQADAERLAHEHRRSKLLGILGDDEVLAGVQLIHRMVLKLDFEEKVERSLLQRLVGPEHDQRLGSVYLHSRSLQIVVFTPRDGIHFTDRPADHASAVQDFDGVVTFVEMAPGALALDDKEWLEQRSDSDVRKHFQSRFAASPGLVTPVLVPLWRLVFQSQGDAGYRVTWIDGIVGKPVNWPT